MAYRILSIAVALSMLLAASLASAEAPGELRLTPAEIAAKAQGTAAAGTSGVDRDERTAIVVAGTWFFGYGRVADDTALKTLPAGSFYTEPAGSAHFAMTKDEPVEIVITGYGPSDTQYVDHANDPNRRR